MERVVVWRERREQRRGGRITEQTHQREVDRI